MFQDYSIYIDNQRTLRYILAMSPLIAASDAIAQMMRLLTMGDNYIPIELFGRVVGELSVIYRYQLSGATGVVGATNNDALFSLLAEINTLHAVEMQRAGERYANERRDEMEFQREMAQSSSSRAEPIGSYW